METKGVNLCSKRKLRWTKGGCKKSERSNLGKRRKVLDDSSMKNRTITVPTLEPTDGKCSAKEKVDKTNSKQDEQRKIYRKKGEKNIFDQEESESSEEEEGITVEELKKTEGWKMLMEALDAKIEKNKSSTK